MLMLVNYPARVKLHWRFSRPLWQLFCLLLYYIIMCGIVTNSKKTVKRHTLKWTTYWLMTVAFMWTSASQSQRFNGKEKVLINSNFSSACLLRVLFTVLCFKVGSTQKMISRPMRRIWKTDPNWHSRISQDTRSILLMCIVHAVVHVENVSVCLTCPTVQSMICCWMGMRQGRGM